MIWQLKKIWYRTKIFSLKLILKFLKVESPFTMEGSGVIKELCPKIRDRGINKVLLVTDKNLVKLGLLDELMKSLEKEKIDYVMFDKVLPNPTIKCVEEARERFIDEKCSAFIAFGGGSVMDCAKVAGARVTNSSKPVKKMRGNLKIRKSLPPIFAIPTTAGTGSEATLAAVITDSETHEKFAVNDPKIIPELAVLDPDLTQKLPPAITATTGMDALTHAVEAYIGTAGTEFTDRKAVEAVKLIFDNLYGAYEKGQEAKYRLNMARASYYAGESFTRAFIGYVHAIAHNLGGMYGVPHGLANAVVLPYVLKFYGEKSKLKLSELAIEAGLGRANENKEVLRKRFVDYIIDMNKKMGIPDYIKELREEDIELIATRALKEANGNYPVPKIMDKEQCMDILRKLMR